MVLVRANVAVGDGKPSSGASMDVKSERVRVPHSDGASSLTAGPVPGEDVPRVTVVSVASEDGPRDGDSSSAAVLALSLIDSSAEISGILEEESVPEDDR